MIRKMILAVLAGSVAAMVIYLARKKIAEINQRNARKKKNDRLKVRRTPKFSDQHGEYTL